MPDWMIYLFATYFIPLLGLTNYTVVKATVITPEQLIEHTVCPICLDAYNSKDKVLILKCSHLFHKKCLQKWIEKSINCPICRKIIEQ